MPLFVVYSDIATPCLCRVADNGYPSDKEIELVHELGQKILAQEKMLNLASDICGELDRYDL